ncbi:MAG: amidase, partial [Alphaproteobacteria bacterium]|nr:amidase [Alphaproteobacteria bacterium]
QAGRLTSTELIERLLARIEAYDDKLHAFIAVYAEEARMAAAAADQAIRSGHAVGPFHGVPVALKDIIDMEGRITTGGSKAWADRVSPVTATLARRLIAAGMIVIGKTHTVEFAMGGWGTNTHMGTPWNPWDLEVPRTPGGSSAGSGVSVAAGRPPGGRGPPTRRADGVAAAGGGGAGQNTPHGRVST